MKDKIFREDRFFGWLMSSPALLLLLVFVLLPLFLGSFWSLTNKRLISPLPTEFVGLQNYNRILSFKIIEIKPDMDEVSGEPIFDAENQLVYPRVRDVIKENERLKEYRQYKEFNFFGRHMAVIAKDPQFYTALFNTILYVLLIVPLVGVFSLLLALLVNQKIWGVTFFRVVYFVPAITSISVTSVVWVFLYNPEQGLINRLLQFFSFGAFGHSQWLQSADTALLAIILFTLWQASGLFMVIFLGGLQDIPEHLYEAARIDGANRLQTLIFVTIPQLRNTIIYVIISSTILGFRLFTQVDVMTKGGPQDSTMTLIYHVVNEGFRNQKIGYASALTIVFFLFILIVAFIQRSVMKSESTME